MSKVTQPQEDHMRRTIRDAMAIDPLISQRSLLAIIEKKYNRSMSFTYLIRLIKKVQGEIKVRPDLESVEKRVAEMRETIRVLRAEAFRMAFPPENALEKPSVKDRRLALELIAKLDHRQATLEMDFGVFTRHLGEVDANVRHSLLDDGVVVNIANTMRQWGIQPPGTRKIDASEAITVKATEIPNEPPKQQPSEPEPAPGPTQQPVQRLVEPRLAGGFQVNPGPAVA